MEASGDAGSEREDATINSFLDLGGSEDATAITSTTSADDPLESQRQTDDAPNDNDETSQNGESMVSDDVVTEAVDSHEKEEENQDTNEGDGKEFEEPAPETKEDEEMEEAKRAEKEREGILKSIFGDDNESDSDVSDVADLKDEDSDSDLSKRNKKKLDRILKKKQSKEKRELKRKRKKEKEEERAAKKSKSKSRTEKQSKKRKRKSPEDEENSELAESKENASGEEGSLDTSLSQKEESPFDQALNSIKRPRKKKLDASAIENSVIDLITKMEDAADMDLESFRNGEPGLAKLKLLNKVTDTASKVDIQSTMLNKGVLSTFRRWLEPLPDGSLPSFNIRRDLLHAMIKLPIRTDHLKPSGIGKAVMSLWKSPKETPENKKLARELIQEWSRDIFELTTDYRHLTEFEQKKQRQSVQRPSSPKNVEEENPVDLDDVLRNNRSKLKVTDNSFHARIPQPSPLDYTKRPPRKSKELLQQESQQHPTLERRRSLDKKLANIKAKRKGSQITNQSRAVKMSITGSHK